MNRWGEFEILDKIGHGGFGTVYRAFHPALAREVALKLIAVPEDHPREIEKALEEAKRLARVRHRNVVTVHDARYLDGHVGICMELIHGESVAQVVERQGRFGAAECRSLATTLCRALGAVHRVGVIHSDVKAQNVMREDGGRIVLMDFGAGRQLREPDRTTRLQIIGTPAYMAPEIFRFKDPSPASDVYSMGVLLFFVLTGTFPVDARSLEDFAAAHARRTRRHLGDLRDDLPEGLIGVIEKALEPRRRDRYRTPGAMLADLSSGRVAGPAANIQARTQARELSTTNGTDNPRASLSRPTPPAQQGSLAAFQAALPRIAAAAAGAIASIWLLGFLATKVYDVMFGLSGEFADDSPLEWLETGFRSLVLPMAYMLMAVLAFVVLRFVWRIVARLIPRARNWATTTTQAFQTAVTRAGLHEGSSPTSAVLIAQAALLAAVVWYFDPLIKAFTTPMGGVTPAIYLPLSPERENDWLLFCGVTSVLALASAAAWAMFIRRRGPGTGVVSIAAGLVLTAIYAAMFAVPWRVVYQSTFQVATFRSEPCFIVAERSSRTMLSCVGAEGMHSLVVNDNDPALKRFPYRESIFGAASRVARHGETR